MTKQKSDKLIACVDLKSVFSEENDEKIVKQEEEKLPQHLNKRSSIQVNKKRKIKKKLKEIDEEVKQSPLKKRKTIEEKSLDELFLPDHLEDDKDCLFRFAENEIVCWKCLKKGESDLKLCAGGCNKKFHIQCLNAVEDPSINKDELKICYLCDLCSREVFTCSICFEDLYPENEDNYKCNYSKCGEKYHKKCLQLLSKNSKTCLKHYCHTCHLNDRTKDEKIVSCVKCPLSYHADILCIPVSTKIISSTQIICPIHHAQNNTKPINVKLCTYCRQDGKLILCDTCPRAFHKNCMTVEIPDDNKKLFRCDECVIGILPLYNSIVWVKVGNYRWWPGFVLVPWTVPLNLLNKQKDETEFCVRFLGTYDFCYTTYNKVIPYANNETIEELKVKSKLDIDYNKAITQARELLAILDKNGKIEFGKIDSNEFNETGLDELKSSNAVYKSIQISRPIKPVKIKKTAPEPCKCKATDINPCTSLNGCINAVLFIECDDSCPAGKKCQNQKVRSRDNVKLKIIESRGRGFGAFCMEDIKPNTFIIEYIGELINNEELNRRLDRKKDNNEKEYYFLTIQNNLCIDAEFYSNKGRFINHSCEPNCVIRKVIVDGITRIGIFSNQFIKAHSELTFNYNMEFGKGFSIKCNCGTASCTGVIGKNFQNLRRKSSKNLSD